MVIDFTVNVLLYLIKRGSTGLRVDDGEEGLGGKKNEFCDAYIVLRSRSLFLFIMLVRVLYTDSHFFRAF